MLANQQKQEEILIQENEKKREAKVAEDREHDQDVVGSSTLMLGKIGFLLCLSFFP